jgi:hypothetical protein
MRHHADASCLHGRAFANRAATISAQHQTRNQQSFDSCTYLSAWVLARALRHQSLTGLSLSAPWLPPWTAQQRLLV